MRHIADRFTVILDASVLYPFLIRDVLLCLAEAGLYRPRWSLEIMNEWSSRLIEAKPEKKDRILRTADLMTGAFPEALVGGYQDLVSSLNLPDPNDRHVLAAAIKTGASVIVTENMKDFPAMALAQYDIEARTADEFAVEIFQLYGTDAVTAMRTMRRQYENPSKSPDDLIIALIGSGLVNFAGELGPHRDSL